MRVRLTFDFTDEQRKAIGKVMGCRKPASRKQLVQYFTARITQIGALLEEGLRAAQRQEEASHPTLFPLDAPMTSTAPLAEVAP